MRIILLKLIFLFSSVSQATKVPSFNWQVRKEFKKICKGLSESQDAIAMDEVYASEEKRQISAPDDCNTAGKITMALEEADKKIKKINQKIAKYVGKDILKKCKTKSAYSLCLTKSFKESRKLDKSIDNPENFKDMRLLKYYLDRVDNYFRLKNNLNNRCASIFTDGTYCGTNDFGHPIDPMFADASSEQKSRTILGNMAHRFFKSQCKDPLNPSKTKCELNLGKKKCLNVFLEDRLPVIWNKQWKQKEYESLKNDINHCEDLCRDEFTNPRKDISSFCQKISELPEYKKLSKLKPRPRENEKIKTGNKCFNKLADVEQMRGDLFYQRVRCKQDMLNQEELNAIRKPMDELQEIVKQARDPKYLESKKRKKYEEFMGNIFRTVGISETMENHCKMFGNDNSIGHILGTKKCKKYKGVLNYYLKDGRCNSKKGAFINEHKMQEYRKVLPNLLAPYQAMRFQKKQLEKEMTQSVEVNGNAYELNVSINQQGKCEILSDSSGYQSDDPLDGAPENIYMIEDLSDWIEQNEDKVCQKISNIQESIKKSKANFSKLWKQHPVLVGRGELHNENFPNLDQLLKYELKDGRVSDKDLEKVLNGGFSQMKGKFESTIIGLCDENQLSLDDLMGIKNLKNRVHQLVPQYKEGLRCYEHQRADQIKGREMTVLAACIGANLIPVAGQVIGALCGIGMAINSYNQFERSDMRNEFFRRCDTGSSVSCTTEEQIKAQKQKDQALSDLKTEVMFAPLFFFDVKDIAKALKGPKSAGLKKFAQSYNTLENLETSGRLSSDQGLKFKKLTDEIEELKIEKGTDKVGKQKKLAQIQSELTELVAETTLPNLKKMHPGLKNLSDENLKKILSKLPCGI